MAPVPSVEIRKVTDSRSRLVFIKMPWPVYRNDPNWVPPIIFDQKKFLDPERGVFFEHGEAQLFLAYRGKTPVGRISAHVNHLHESTYKDGKGFFGFFECRNDPEAAQALFTAAEEWLRSRGKTRVEGPMSFGIYDDSAAMLVDGFDTAPYLMNAHNPPYYQELLRACGYGKTIDWYAFRATAGRTDKEADPKIFRLQEKVERIPGLTFRPVDIRRHLEREARIVQGIFADAWKGNWGHLPFTDAEFHRIVKEFKRIAVEELSLVAEMNGKPVGFALSLYDANVAVKKINGRMFPFGFLTMLTGIKKTDRFRLTLMGILPEQRNRGIEVAFYARIMEKAVQMGFREAECSMIVETNEAMLNSLSHMPTDRYKTYRIFGKDLAQ